MTTVTLGAAAVQDEAVNRRIPEEEEEWISIKYTRHEGLLICPNSLLPEVKKKREVTKKDVNNVHLKDKAKGFSGTAVSQ